MTSETRWIGGPKSLNWD